MIEFFLRHLAFVFAWSVFVQTYLTTTIMHSPHSDGFDADASTIITGETP